ncbi:MAG TPA: acetamidase/formamidase family protein [Devosia sp.]|nr:acetamidase/formamidase family protein [Devosia sp.]
MTTHHFIPTAWHHVLATLPPALIIESGDTLVTETIDANGWDKHGSKVWKAGNPMNGPIAVAGAEPGDSLRVDILAMQPIRAYGWTRASIAPNVVDPDFATSLPPRARTTWRIDRNAQTAQLDDGSGPVLPLAPMIGCFGVAPEGGQAISTATSGAHGGNMDYRLLGPGATIRFPVSAPGALFFVGDCHALQGDGEIVGTGIETAYEVTIRLSVEKRAIIWPRCENDDDMFTIGNARPLEQALQHATTEMIRWLEEDYGLDIVAASNLLGQTVRYDIGNIYDPAFTVGCRIAKKWLPAR